ncbi:hypothetical protein EN46_07325 [Citrobacter amalonaticus]
MATPDWEAIKAAYQSGVSARSLAARFGVSHTAINKRAKKEGWTVVSTEVSNQPKVSSGNQSGNQSGNPSETSNRKALSKVSTRKKSENSPETKPIRGSRYDPPTNAFTAHNTEALKHGAYARRLLWSDAIIADVPNTELRDELFLLRAANLYAAENIGRWTVQIEDATPEEQKNLREQIAAAEKGMRLNIASIESIEYSIRNNLRVEAATAKLRAETQKLTAENQGVTTPMTEILSVLHHMSAGRLDDIPEE